MDKIRKCRKTTRTNVPNFIRADNNLDQFFDVLTRIKNLLNNIEFETTKVENDF